MLMFTLAISCLTTSDLPLPKANIHILLLYFSNNDVTMDYQYQSEKNVVAIMVNKRVRNAVLGCSLKNDRMISVRFQGKPLSITVIQVYAPMSNAKEAEVEWFYENL